MTREPAVAGQFYAGSSKALKAQIDSMIDKSAKRQKVRAVVSPHAGYIYSGGVAGALFSSVEVTDTVVILGPNHTGLGPTFSLYSRGSWRTPLGDVEIDAQLCDDIISHSSLIKADESAHRLEHSLEVQVPFLQYFKDSLKIVPIVVREAGIDAYKSVANAIAESIKQRKEDILIIASSDMTHYQPHKSVETKDKLAIDAILNLDEGLLLERVSKYDISMCGAIPAAITLIASKALGAKKARLIKYQTSGDVSGDYSAVVGYAGIAII